MTSSETLGEVTIGPGYDPAAVWEKIRVLALKGGLTPLASARLALAGLDMAGALPAPVILRVTAAVDGHDAWVEAAVQGRSEPVAAAVTPRPAAVPAPGPAQWTLLDQAAEHGGMPALLSAALTALDELAGRAAGYKNEIFQLRAELDATSQGLMALHADLSDQRDQLEKAHADAEEASRAKAAFLAAMSHEIRSPLNAMIGFTSLLQRTVLTPDQASYAETLSAAGSHLKDLVDGILDLSKVESGQFELEESPFDLIACIEDAAALVAPTAESKHLVLATLIEPDLPVTVTGDALRIRQILVNLLSNAVKFTSHGQVIVEASTQAGPSEHESLFAFAVHDTGPGIPASRLGRLFEPFTQASTSISRRFGGTGLGLAISKQLTERMAGQLTVTTAPGQGATFTATIPLRLQGCGRPAAQPDRPLLGLHILVVHPHAAIAEAARRHLAAWGAEVTVTTSAEHAAVRGADWADVVLAVVGAAQPDRLPATIRTLTAVLDGRILPVVCLVPLSWQPAAAALPLKWTVSDAPIRRERLREAVLGALGRPDHPRAAAQALPATESGPALRILVAEDDPANQQAIALILRHLGHHADLAADGNQAVTCATQHSYDLIFMDVDMPSLDGIAATREIRARLPGRRPPIVALTARDTPATRQACADAGMTGFLAKPFQPRDLADVITSTVAAPQPAERPPAGPAQEGHGHGAAPAPTVLYIDDDPDLRTLVEEVFAKDPTITIVTAADADSGLRLAATGKPSLILLDLHLPGAGESLLQTLRASDGTSTIPVVIVTGDTSPRTAERVTSLGATSYLAKPFSIEQLKATIATAWAAAP